MTRGMPALAQVLRRLALSLLAAVLVAFIAATVLVLTWLLFEGTGATGDAPYAWLDLFTVTLAFGSPSAVLFGLVVAPLAALAGCVHAG